MVNSKFISHEIHLENARDLFIPFLTKVSSSKLTRLQTLIELLREIIFFIPKTIQRKYFVENFNKKINLIANVQENLQANDPDNLNFIIDSCVKRLKQLNSLCKVHLLIKDYYGYAPQITTESLVNDLIIKNQILISKCINEAENKKNSYQYAKQIEYSPKSLTIDMEDGVSSDIIAKSIQFPQESVENEENGIIFRSSSERGGLERSITSETQVVESLPSNDHMEKAENESFILTDEQAKSIETGSSIELSQRSEDAQALPPLSLIKANNSDIRIGIYELNENTAKSNNSEGLWGRVKNWTGVKGLQTGVQNVRSGNYVKGFYEIASGSIRIALTAYAAFLVAQQIISRFENDIEIPGVGKSQIQSESFNSAISNRKITLITAYDEGIKDYAQYVIPNQRAFSVKNGYDYIEYYGNLAHDQDGHRAPYWSKVVAINDQLQKGKEGEWIVWGDASALFTNTKKNFDEIIEKYGSDKDVILSNDPMEKWGIPINNAVILIKNTPWTKNWIKKVWQRSDLARGGEGNCWTNGQPLCHYEQQAMTELWKENPDVQLHSAIISNKIMNAFYRYSHYDSYRNMQLNYNGDPESSKWASGDFICKVTGMDKDRRLKIIQHVANNCIDKNCDRIEF